jgi:hypothetical protein
MPTRLPAKLKHKPKSAGVLRIYVPTRKTGPQLLKPD